jgi:hypothetical protein
MAAAVPTIVSDVGAFSEFPDDAVVKIEHDRFGDALLQTYLAKLIEDKALRRRIGRNARAYVLAEHNIETSSAKYAAFVREVIARRPRTNLLKNISGEMAVLGIRSSDEALLRGVAVEVATLAPVAEFANVHSHFRPPKPMGTKAGARLPTTGKAKRRVGVENKAAPEPAAEAIDADSGRMPQESRVSTTKEGARDYATALSTELNYYLRTKPFANLHKPIKFSGDGMDPETARHFTTLRISPWRWPCAPTRDSGC